MAETKNKVVTVESLKTVYDTLNNKLNGIGGDCVQIDSWDNAKANGFYSCDGWYGYVIALDDNHFVQRCYTLRNDSVFDHLFSRERYYNNGTWGVWEWTNPPCEVGIEYRTTERFKGWPVYTALIDAGQVPNNGKSSIPMPDGISPASIIRIAGQLSSGEIIPAIWDNSRVEMFCSKTHAYITSNDGNWSNNTATIQIWYVK